MMRRSYAEFIRVSVCCMALQGMAVCVMLVNRRAGIGLLLLEILFLGIWTAVFGRKRRELRTCPKCGAESNRLSRVCGQCGNPFEDIQEEQEFETLMREEERQETPISPEELEKDFEMVEEVDVETAMKMEGLGEIFAEKRRRDDRCDFRMGN